MNESTKTAKEINVNDGKIPSNNFSPDNQEESAASTKSLTVPVSKDYLPFLNSVKNQNERYIIALKDVGITPDQIVQDIVILQKTQSDVETKRSNLLLKPVTLAISTGFILVPLLPGVNAVVATAIASIGAVGFGAALYDIYGAKAFEAGKAFRSFFHKGGNDD